MSSSIHRRQPLLGAALIGKTVQVVRVGGSWVIRHRGQVVAEHAVDVTREVEIRDLAVYELVNTWDRS